MIQLPLLGSSLQHDFISMTFITYRICIQVLKHADLGLLHLDFGVRACVHVCTVTIFHFNWMPGLDCIMLFHMVLGCRWCPFCMHCVTCWLDTFSYTSQPHPVLHSLISHSQTTSGAHCLFKRPCSKQRSQIPEESRTPIESVLYAFKCGASTCYDQASLPMQKPLSAA